MAALDYAAGNSRMLLRNFYTKSLHSLRKGLDEPPYAFIIPADQGDPMRVAQLVARLQSQHIEVSRTDAPLTLKEGSFPAGTYVVKLGQPYRNYAVDLLTPQNYPEGRRRTLRRCVLGTAGVLSSRRHSDRRCVDSRPEAALVDGSRRIRTVG